MPDDPLVREVREVRDRLAGKLNHDVEAIIRELMASPADQRTGSMFVCQTPVTNLQSTPRHVANVWPAR